MFCNISPSWFLISASLCLWSRFLAQRFSLDYVTLAAVWRHRRGVGGEKTFQSTVVAAWSKHRRQCWWHFLVPVRFLTIAWSHHTLPVRSNGFSLLPVSPISLSKTQAQTYTQQSVSLNFSCSTILFKLSILHSVFSSWFCSVPSICLSLYSSLIPALASIFICSPNLISSCFIHLPLCPSSSLLPLFLSFHLFLPWNLSFPFALCVFFFSLSFIVCLSGRQLNNSRTGFT